MLAASRAWRYVVLFSPNSPCPRRSAPLSYYTFYVTACCVVGLSAVGPLQRSVEQVELLSSQLRQRLSSAQRRAATDRGGGGVEAANNAATRLLAREGVDADRLSRDVHSLELKATFEDVFPLHSQQVRQLTLPSSAAWCGLVRG